MRTSPTPDDSVPETLCDSCANQPECNEHHQMCVNFEPIKQDDGEPSKAKVES